MRYSQITTSRLSKAARKLDPDGAWHPFQSTPFAWYRIWKKRLVQRVNFENADEEELLLPFVQRLEPLPEMATTTGFREELTIRSKNKRLGDENAFEVVISLGYESPFIEEMRTTLGSYQITLSPEGPLLFAHLPLTVLTTEELTQAQEQILAVRLFFQAVTTSDSPRAFEAAKIGFQNMMRRQ
ncbi:MAG TPA: hypothetical protein VG537_01315 [Candidatus Kapabacteria bacterium]|nr:hypothetical protein [Candidatus Kapabacteria bacterium]